MQFPAFTIYDFFLLLISAIQFFYVADNYKAFTCSEPINAWEAGVWLVILIVRVLFVIRFTEEYSQKCRLIMKFVLYCGGLPIILTWSILGTVWILNTGIGCIPKALVPWTYYFWLGIIWAGTLIVTVYCIIDIVRQIELNNYARRVSTQRLLQEPAPKKNTQPQIEEEKDNLGA
jgi:hypothetical protein